MGMRTFTQARFLKCNAKKSIKPNLTKFDTEIFIDISEH